MKDIKEHNKKIDEVLMDNNEALREVKEYIKIKRWYSLKAILPQLFFQ